MMNSARTMSSTAISQTSVTHANRETTPTPYTECGQKKQASTWSVIGDGAREQQHADVAVQARNGSDTKIA